VRAFSEMYAQVYTDLYKFALYTLKNPQDAEDAVSEAVIAAYENIGKLRSEKAFKSWMFTILANQCKKKFSERKGTEELGSDIAAPEADYADRQDVVAAFGILNEEERMIVSFSVFGGYKSQEIARILQIKAATVRSKKARALEKMRQVLK